jgi:ornithine carbamoyltransferase
MNIISILDIERDISEVLELAERLKEEARRGIFRDALRNKSLAMIFEKPSTRTRVSFEVAMTQLGGHAIYLDRASMQLGRGESLKDTARTLSRYVDGIMIRAESHENLLELSRHATIPVINGLTELEHPCQVIADLFTIKEKKGTFDGVKLAFIGDGNNVCHSLLLGSAMVGMRMAVATPRGYEPRRDILDKAVETAGSRGSQITLTNDPGEAVKNADIIYTDVWVSMGQEAEREKRLRDFKGFQVNTALVKKAGNPLIMHCLPAKRGLEITDDVLESRNSIVFDQAENRLHMQKALLCHLMGTEGA